jgi:hypothetical protein
MVRQILEEATDVPSYEDADCGHRDVCPLESTQQVANTLGVERKCVERRCVDELVVRLYRSTPETSVADSVTFSRSEERLVGEETPQTRVMG